MDDESDAFTEYNRSDEASSYPASDVENDMVMGVDHPMVEREADHPMVEREADHPVTEREADHLEAAESSPQQPSASAPARRREPPAEEAIDAFLKQSHAALLRRHFRALRVLRLRSWHVKQLLCKYWVRLPRPAAPVHPPAKEPAATESNTESPHRPAALTTPPHPPPADEVPRVQSQKWKDIDGDFADVICVPHLTSYLEGANLPPGPATSPQGLRRELHHTAATSAVVVGAPGAKKAEAGGEKETTAMELAQGPPSWTWRRRRLPAWNTENKGDIPQYNAACDRHCRQLFSRPHVRACLVQHQRGVHREKKAHLEAARTKHLFLTSLRKAYRPKLSRNHHAGKMRPSSAPVTGRRQFAIGDTVYVEGGRHVRQSTVVDVDPEEGRVKVHFFGHTLDYDTWFSCDDPSLRLPADKATAADGSCRRRGRRGKRSPSSSSSSSLFSSSASSSSSSPAAKGRRHRQKPQVNFSTGMALYVTRGRHQRECMVEAVDTAARRVRVTFPGFSPEYDMWLDFDDPRLKAKPVMELPQHWKPSGKRIPRADHTLYSSSLPHKPAADARDPPRDVYRVGDQLMVQCGRQRRVGTVREVDLEEHRVKITFAGFSSEYDTWLETNDPRIIVEEPDRDKRPRKLSGRSGSGSATREHRKAAPRPSADRPRAGTVDSLSVGTPLVVKTEGGVKDCVVIGVDPEEQQVRVLFDDKRDSWVDIASTAPRHGGEYATPAGDATPTIRQRESVTTHRSDTPTTASTRSAASTPRSRSSEESESYTDSFESS